MSSPKKKKQKVSNIKMRSHTYDGWYGFINDLGLYDAKYEKDKYLMKEYSLTNHFLEAFELMSQVRGQAYTADSFTITLIEMNRQRNKNIQSTEQLKLFLTSFLNSFQNLVSFSNELCFFTRMIDPNELANLQPGLIQFYSKVRKYVTHNFVNEREAQQKSLNFGIIKLQDQEQWVSVVSRFLDNKAIVTIGNQIKEKATQTNNNEKIMENSVEYFDLIVLCYEEQEKRLRKKNPNDKQVEAQNIQKTTEFNRNDRYSNEYDQEGAYEDYSKQNSKAHKIAYNIAMGPPDSLKKSRDKEAEQSYMQEYREPDEHPSNPINKYDKIDSQHKMIVQLNDTKHKIMEDMMRQNVVFNDTLRIHENLAINYKYVANFSQELQNLVGSLVIKIRNGQSIGEQELKMLEKHSQFDEFLQEDPEITLSKTGIYEVIKKI